MTTILPPASSSCTRTGRTSMMRASTWRSFVMMPDWLPVKLIASPPNSRIAIDRSAIAIRSPAVRSMSSSRRSGLGDTCLASASRSSVVSPMAETTTTTSCPARRVRITRSATCRMRVTSATLEPPYFCTTMDTRLINHKDHKEHKAHKDVALTKRAVVGRKAERRKPRRHRCAGVGPRARLRECRDDRRVIARADLLLHRTRDHTRGERRARHDVIEPPADVALPQVAPRRPPREQAVVVGIDGAPQIDQAAAQDPLDHRALFRQLADRAGLALLGMHVSVRPRDVQVAAQHELTPARLKRARVRVHRVEEPHLGGEVLAAVRHVHRRHGHLADAGAHRRRDDPALVIEFRMREQRPFGCDRLADMEADARVAFSAVPVAPVALHLAERGRHLIRGGFDFLQADDIRALALDPFLQLRLPRPNAVDVPGCDLHQLSAESDS